MNIELTSEQIDNVVAAELRKLAQMDLYEIHKLDRADYAKWKLAADVLLEYYGDEA